jgi:hypothetical protein
MTTYNWVISVLDTAPSEDGLTDVVKTVHWRYQATNDTYFADIYGSVGLDTPESAQFTPYAELTEADVVTWLESKLDVEELKANLDGQLERLANPPIVNLPLPWVTPEVESEV